MIILWNNRFVAESEATIPLLSEAVLFGFGAFETLRANADGMIIELDAHVERLRRSLDAIQLPVQVSPDELKAMVRRVVDKGSNGLQRLRILAVPEGIAVTSIPLNIDANVYGGVSVKTVVQHRAIPDVKSLSYLECLLSYREAGEAGYFEAFLVDRYGQVFEGSRSNIFWVNEGQVYTRESGVLPGITRRLVLDHVSPSAKFASIDTDGLKSADEVFMSSSTLGAVPVTSIDDTRIGNGVPGSVTESVMEALKKYYY